MDLSSIGILEITEDETQEAFPATKINNIRRKVCYRKQIPSIFKKEKVPHTVRSI